MRTNSDIKRKPNNELKIDKLAAQTKRTEFEEETVRYRTTDYHWIANDNGNLLGLNRDNKVCFTWQPHGSQFTIHTEVPEKAVKFSIQKPPALQKEDVLKNIGFTDEWIKIVK